MQIGLFQQIGTCSCGKNWENCFSYTSSANCGFFLKFSPPKKAFHFNIAILLRFQLAIFCCMITEESMFESLFLLYCLLLEFSCSSYHCVVCILIRACATEYRWEDFFFPVFAIDGRSYLGAWTLAIKSRSALISWLCGLCAFKRVH